jgi:hypothetical protein
MKKSKAVREVARELVAISLKLERVKRGRSIQGDVCFSPDEINEYINELRMHAVSLDDAASAIDCTE